MELPKNLTPSQSFTIKRAGDAPITIPADYSGAISPQSSAIVPQHELLDYRYNFTTQKMDVLLDPRTQTPLDVSDLNEQTILMMWVLQAKSLMEASGSSVHPYADPNAKKAAP